MADNSAPEVDVDSVIERLLEGKKTRFLAI